MLSQLRRFGRENWLLLIVFAAASCFALFFAVHTIRDFVYFNDPANVDVDLQPWMTPRFIVLTYDLPRPFVFETLGLDPDADGGKRLGHLARERDLTMEELTEMIRKSSATYRETQQ